MLDMFFPCPYEFYVSEAIKVSPRMAAVSEICCDTVVFIKLVLVPAHSSLAHSFRAEVNRYTQEDFFIFDWLPVSDSDLGLLEETLYHWRPQLA